MEGRDIKNNFSEDDVRFYVVQHHKDFQLSSIVGTNIVGTPDVVALEDGEVKLIEIKRKLGDISHQIRTNKINNIHEIWYAYDDAPDSIKELLVKNNIKLRDISSYLDAEKLKQVREINLLSRQCYHLMTNKSGLIVESNFVFDAMKLVGIQEADKYLYDVDEIFELLYNAFSNDNRSFLKLRNELGKFELLNEAERIKLAKKRKTGSLNDAENSNYSKTKFCFKCGATLPLNANFCVSWRP